MKTLFSIIAILGLTGCLHNKTQAPLNMKGTYSTMIPATPASSGDSVIQKEQFKMYTDHHMIYVYPQSTDSLAIYGIGTYEIRDGKVIENVFHTSLNGPKKDTFTLHIDKSDKGYQQVIEYVSNYNKRYFLRENYKKVGKAITSPLDGAWKLTKSSTIDKNGNVVVNRKITQFKLYQSGNFVWVNTYPNQKGHSTNSRFGYGEFEMNGSSSFKEINANSTHSSLVDTPVLVDLKFLNKDMYQQTIQLENDSRLVEVYRKLETNSIQ